MLLKEVFHGVVSHTGIPVARLKKTGGKHRAGPASETRIRQMAFFLCKHFTHASYPEIARFFGGFHHTSVMHAVAKFKAECERRQIPEEAMSDFGRLLEVLMEKETR